MNRKGFTLIELLAIIVVIAIVGVLVAPSVINSFNKSKDKAYDLLIDNIKTAGENYYQECEYGNLKNIKQNYCIKREGSDNTLVTNLGILVETGLLKANQAETNGQNKIVNPATNKDIKNCQIEIIKNVDKETYKTTFDVVIDEDCIIDE